MDIRLKPSPTIESHPRARDIATAIGTTVTLSSKIPAVDASSIKTNIITAMRRYFRFPNFFMMTATIYLSTPHLSRSKNVPPISTIKAMMRIPVMPVSRVDASTKTITGEAKIFHMGIL